MQCDMILEHALPFLEFHYVSHSATTRDRVPERVPYELSIVLSQIPVNKGNAIQLCSTMSPAGF